MIEGKGELRKIELKEDGICIVTCTWLKTVRMNPASNNKKKKGPKVKHQRLRRNHDTSYVDVLILFN